MTPTEARKLCNDERTLYNVVLDAWNMWTDKNSEEQKRKYFAAYGTWQQKDIEIRYAKLNYPHLFAPFAA